MNILRPLHAQIEHGSTTLKEQSFNQVGRWWWIKWHVQSPRFFQTYYRELQDAYEHCQAFQRTGNPQELSTAWNLYYGEAVMGEAVTTITVRC